MAFDIKEDGQWEFLMRGPGPAQAPELCLYRGTGPKDEFLRPFA